MGNRLIKAAVFSFTKPSLTATLASGRVALYLSELLGLPMFYDERVADETYDILFLVNGPTAFCGCLAAVGAASLAAKRVVWVQNDYTCVPPLVDSSAESPYRKAFQDRAKRGQPAIDYWTTVMKNVASTDGSAYINWNSLSYEPLPIVDLPSATARDDLFYYGSYRVNRVDMFDRYLAKSCPVPVTISSPSKKFAARYPHAKMLGAVPHDQLIAEIGSHGLGLYIEDTKSHSEFHSPAARFYEMLGAGLPMVFQPEAVKMLRQAGFDSVRYYVVDKLKRLELFMRDRTAIAEEQQALWAKPYRQLLDEVVVAEFTCLKGLI